MDDLYCVPGVTCSDPPRVLGTYRDAIAESFSLPFYIVIGNHDDRYFDTFSDTATPWGYWVSVFAGTEHFPAPYYEVVHKGFSFLMLNATDLAYDHASNDLPSFGEAQLAWLDTALSSGRPAVLFWHHFIRPAEVGAENQALLEMLSAHKDVVRAVFSGHEHRWDLVSWEGIDFHQTANMGKASNLPYHVVVCDPQTGTLSVTRHEEPDPI